MRVLFVHNYYQQPGGEDVVFAACAALLTCRGHAVVEYTEHNDRIEAMSRLTAAARTVWSRPARRRLRDLLVRARVDVAHFHNTFPLVSPAAYYACREAGVPVVQELPNYRLVCPSATLYREGRPCETCLGRAVAWPGVVHGCYRESRTASAAVALMLATHRGLGTWREMVDVYVALTEFGRRRFIEGGLPADRVVVRPNHVDPDPGTGAHEGGYALFVGRLAREKGVETLLSAWRRLGGRVRLKVVGAGPEATRLADPPDGVEWLGRLPREAVMRLMQDAAVLVFPSEWYEGFPMALVEAFSTGLPVIASRLGAMADVVEDGRTGLLFTPGDPADLALAADRAFARPGDLAEMGREARRRFESEYAADRNYVRLVDIYDQAIRRASARRSPRPAAFDRM